MRLQHKVLRLSAVFAILLLTLPFAASAQDATEAAPGDEDGAAFTLTLLNDGEAVEGVFEGDVTAQLYGFYGTAGDVISVSMTQAEDVELDPYLVVLGPLGQLIGRDDDSGGDFAAQITDVELPTDGVYFVVASTFSDINSIEGVVDEDATGEPRGYSITLNGVTPVEESADLEYFYSLLQSGDSLVGYSTPEEPVYYFAYVTEEAETAVDVRLTSDDFDTLLMVFAPGGYRIAVNDDGEEGTNSSVTGLELAEAGRYLIFATDVGFPNAGDEEAELSYVGGDFEITITAAAE